MTGTEGSVIDSFLHTAQNVSTNELTTYVCGLTPNKEVIVAKSLYLGAFHKYPKLQKRLRKRFEVKVTRELCKFRELSNEILVPVLKQFWDNHHQMIATHLHPNGTIWDWIIRQTRLDLQSLCCVINRIFQAVQYLHERRIVHGHIHINSVLMRGVDPQSVALMCDVSARSELLKLCSPVPVQEEYCPPEMAHIIQIAARHTGLYHNGYRSRIELLHLDFLMRPKRSHDVWHIGIIAHKLLTGQYPFRLEDILRKKLDNLDHPMLSTYPDSVVKMLKRLLEPQVVKRATAKDGACESWFANHLVRDDLRNLHQILEYHFLKPDFDCGDLVHKILGRLQTCAPKQMQPIL